ncbi:hypothetical protein ID866_8891, partial [Astraeus odoratus]
LIHPHSKGVAIVFNKRLLETKNEKINILGVYASNDSTKNKHFWEIIHDSITYIPQPDVILGDFNFMEDPLNRLSAHFDSSNTIETWCTLKSKLHLIDGWRKCFPNKLNYSFAQSARQGGHQSCIDRIYVQSAMIPYCKDWSISPSPIHTNHQLVHVRFFKQSMSFLGKGYWTLNPSLLRNKETVESIRTEAKLLHHDLTICGLNRSTQDNPQRRFKAFKDKVILTLCNRAKKIILILAQKIRNLQEQLQTTLNDTTMPDEERLLISAELREKISTIKHTLHYSKRDKSHLKLKIECESPTSKLWSKLGKESKPRDTISELKSLDSSPEHPTYIARSDKMADLASVISVPNPGSYPGKTWFLHPCHIPVNYPL